MNWLLTSKRLLTFINVSLLVVCASVLLSYDVFCTELGLILMKSLEASINFGWSCMKNNRLKSVRYTPLYKKERQLIFLYIIYT